MTNATYEGNAGALHVVKVYDGKSWVYCIAADDEKQPALQEGKKALWQALDGDVGLAEREEFNFMQHQCNYDNYRIGDLMRNLRNHFGGRPPFFQCVMVHTTRWEDLYGIGVGLKKETRTRASSLALALSIADHVNSHSKDLLVHSLLAGVLVVNVPIVPSCPYCCSSKSNHSF